MMGNRLLGIFVVSIVLAFFIGKESLRDELRTYGCEYVVKHYEVKP